MTGRPTNRLVGEWDKDGNLKVDFVPIDPEPDTEHSPEGEPSSSRQVLELRRVTEDPTLRVIDFETAIHGLSNTRRGHTWGE